MSYRKDGIFYEPIHFAFHECDNNATARLSSILSHMSNIAGDDYADLGFSHDKLWSDGMVFLVSRMSLRIIRNIKSGEDITLATYERGIKGPMFNRNYEVIDKDGNTIIEAKSAWILCDPATRRILRPGSLDRKVSENWERLPDCPEPLRIKVPKDAVYIGDRKIVYSDIDANGHVFNAFYANIACDFLPFEIASKPIREFSINFQHEAILGDILKVYTHVSSNHATVVGTPNGADMPSFICEFVF